MVAGSAVTLLMAEADSARALAAVYTLSVLAMLPVIVVAVAMFTLRRATAGARLLAWRCAILVLVLAFVGRLAMPSVDWVVPPPLAAPLIALGRVQMATSPLRSLVGAQESTGASSHATAFIGGLLIVYLTGVTTVLLSTLVASMRLRRQARPADAADENQHILSEVRRTLGTRRAVRLLVSPDVRVPMTWGFLHPVVMLPAGASDWTPPERRIVLLHELAHVRSGDWAFNLAARLACALYWFHPGVWWIARGLREDCELACDDRVLNSGVRRSDYAELLFKAAELLRSGERSAGAELAFSRSAGLRARLAAVLDIGHDARPLARGWAAAALLASLAIAGTMSVVRLTRSRDVLTTLMNDARWESRAYAVVGLAQRADSIAVARSAAERDPSPRVRAWARHALAEGEGKFAPVHDVRGIIHD